MFKFSCVRLKCVEKILLSDITRLLLLITSSLPSYLSRTFSTILIIFRYSQCSQLFYHLLAYSKILFKYLSLMWSSLLRHVLIVIYLCFTLLFCLSNLPGFHVLVLSVSIFMYENSIFYICSIKINICLYN